MSDAAREHLDGAWRRLDGRWEATKAVWTDGVQAQFAQEFYAPLAQQTDATLRQIAELMHLIATIENTIP